MIAFGFNRADYGARSGNIVAILWASKMEMVFNGVESAEYEYSIVFHPKQSPTNFIYFLYRYVK